MNKVTGYFLWLAIILFAGSKGFKLIVSLSGALSSDVFTIVVSALVYVGLCSFALCALIYKWVYSRTSNSLNEYKRELEKESIDKTESSSRIKVLESKIEVLEKALEQALKG